MHVETETLIQQSGNVLDLHAQADARYAELASARQNGEQERRAHAVSAKFPTHADAELGRLRVHEGVSVFGLGPQAHPGRPDAFAETISRDHGEVTGPTPA